MHPLSVGYAKQEYTCSWHGKCNVLCFLVTTYNYDMYDFRFALAFHGNPTRPQLVALVAEVRCSFHVYVCFADIAM